MSVAKIQDYNGRPAIIIDGKPFPPMAFNGYHDDPAYVRDLRNSGIRIFSIMANTDWLRPGGPTVDDDGNPCIELSGFEAFKEQAERILENAPDAYLLVRLGVHPPADWVENHPDDIVRYSDGTTIPAIIVSEVHGDKLPGAYSLCSDEWRRDGTAGLMDFCDKVDAAPFADRVIGYFLTAGGTSEWYYVNPLVDGDRYADFSPAFRREFSRYLKEKYQTDEKLQQAWNDPNVTIDAPSIPDIQSRFFTDVDGRIVEAMRMQEALPRTMDCDVEMNPERESNIGVFLNMENIHATQVADFFEAWHNGTANSIIHFTRALKERYPDKLTGAFYGPYGCTHYFNNGTSSTLRVLDSGVVDVLASPGDYLGREPGGYVPQREMSDSFALRNTLFFTEDDTRIHTDEPLYRDAMRCYTAEDSVRLLKRDFARNICDGTYAWWFDQHHGGGRYKHPDILALFRRQQEVAAYAFEQNRVKISEIAAIYDQQSTQMVSQGTSDLLLELFRGSELGRIGAPVDHYFHDDMQNDRMADYKMYIMVNVFCLTDEEREAIKRKAAKNGALVLWLYAPGFINPAGQQRIGNGNIEKTIGMKIQRLDDTKSPRFKLIQKDHPALRYGDRDRIYGYIDRDIHDNMWGGYCVSPAFMNPSFSIDDPDAEMLGHYCVDGLPALALKKQPEGWTSVYCAPQILRAELLTSLAEYAGCHLYSYDGDCIYANRSFVTVHAGYTGEHTIHFPRPVDPYEVYEQRFYGNGVRTLKLFMHIGETKMFSFEKIG